MNSARCPECGIPNESGELCRECSDEIKKYRIKPARKPVSKFRWFFVVLVIFCAAMIVYLPR